MRTEADRRPRTHELKTWQAPFQAVWDGIKRFEYRKNDRGFCVGDSLLLKEWNPNVDRQNGAFTGRSLIVHVDYLIEGVFGIPEDYCCMSITEGSRNLEEDVYE